MSTTARTADVDVVTAEIIRNGLSAAAEEMNIACIRTAHSVHIYETKDFGVAIVSADGEMWAEAPGVVVFIGTLPAVAQRGVTRHGRDGFAEGDVLIVNDPFETGTHISDSSIYVPIFHDGELIAFALTISHWADIGGKSPGGWCPDTTDVYQEGLCFNHQKLERGGVRNEEMWDLILHNVRFPKPIAGDLDACIGACRQGAQRVQALCEKFGSDVVKSAMRQTIDRTEGAMREVIAGLQDGVYEAAAEMDFDGVVEDVHPRVCLQLRIDSDRVSASFSGSSEATEGPINLPDIGARSAVAAVLKGFALPTDPTNDGHIKIVDYEFEPGTVVTPTRPAPCDSYGFVAGVLMQLTLRALAQAAPERVPAGTFQLLGMFMYRVKPEDGEPFIMTHPMGGGNGAWAEADGATGPFLIGGDLPNAPAEIVELRYPIRCERVALAPESAGHGKRRGGIGLAYDFRLLERGTYVSVATENAHDTLARGAEGGGDGSVNSVIIGVGDPDEASRTRRGFGLGPFPPGTVIGLRSGGGGGWGDPREREPEQVAADVRDGLLSREEAQSVYGVAVVGEGGATAVDAERTDELRA